MEKQNGPISAFVHTTSDLYGFRSRVNRHLLSLGSFYSAVLFTTKLKLLGDLPQEKRMNLLNLR